MAALVLQCLVSVTVIRPTCIYMCCVLFCCHGGVCVAVRHSCHSDEACPPCAELVQKPCMGEHEVSLGSLGRTCIWRCNCHSFQM